MKFNFVLAGTPIPEPEERVEVVLENHGRDFNISLKGRGGQHKVLVGIRLVEGKFSVMRWKGGEHFNDLINKDSAGRIEDIFKGDK